MNIQFILNGEDIQIVAEAGDRLSDILAGRHYSDSVHQHCGYGVCGRCMVLMDGLPVNSCLVPAYEVRNSEVISWEGLIQTPEYQLIEIAWQTHKLELCSFCRPAVSLLMASLMDSSSRPSDAAIEETLSALNCRCTAPERLFAAGRTVVNLKEGRNKPDVR
ncbi:MAG: aldehyde oxidoreductase [Spirochaetes bacterium]|nr:aldehyde oxidoreductase [Spirochaetota bacterium]MBU0954378.1 aldehyde oxidoreductase [Spirochaetota bacterium]